MKTPKEPRQQRLDRIEYALERLGERQQKHDESLTRIEVALETSIHDHNLRFQKLLEMQADTWRALDVLAGAQKDLTEAQKVTDEKLNILIETVERIIRHRNGKE
jgi:hypothetical protein